ncbi:MAG TPA: proton-conducting transporter membrane subunit [Solirubrobacteraceae bacterium]|jgi:multicomponent Na+:H+ antiporter subunit D
MSNAALASLLPVAVIAPIGGAVLAPLAARIDRRAPLLVSLLALGASLAVLLVVAPRVYGGRDISHYMGNVVPFGGHVLGIAFAADPLGMTFAIATAAIGALLLLFTLSSLRELAPRELGGYACLFQLLLAGLIGSALTADLFNLFVWFEVAALSSYGLTGFYLERPIALEAAFKVLVLTTLASFFIFIGASLLYADHGALSFAQLHRALGHGASTADLVALTLLLCGFATKAGLVPFHGWLPDAHTAAPGPVSALFSALMVNLGVVAIARIVLQIYGPSAASVLTLLLVAGLISAVGGALLALAQDDLKRLLAYDTISQMGVLTVGVATGSAGGLAGTTYHLLSHALFKGLLFLCAGAIVHMTGKTELSKMGGLARRQPVLAVAFTIGVAGIAGVPLLSGYPSLALIHDAARHTDHAAYAVELLAQVITIAALGRAAYLAFYRSQTTPYERFDRIHPGMTIALWSLGLAAVALGVAPGWVIDHVAAPAASSLLHAGVYAHAVLAGAATVPHLHVTLSYFDPQELITVALSIVLGLALATAYVRVGEPAPITLLRRLHNGSVNDYAAFSVVGLLCTLAVLAT